MFAGLVTLVVASIVPLFWCPWSVTWLSNKAYNAHTAERKAYNAHTAERYDVAVDRYTQIIHLDPDNSWAYLNRSIVYQALGQPDKAKADLQRARDIDPSIDEGE
ncbi:tetratricopeptide repeat protein [Pirellulales bacterium]|nr:tetratricopeptide repeat protein [Pirellulales bacterium]